jgi:hypothetical protein
MAHAYAAKRKTTPWQALLDEVESLAAQVAWLEDKITREAGRSEEEGGGDDALRPGGRAWDWVAMREARGDRLARVSRMAIDAGIAEVLVAQVELRGRLMLEAAQNAAAELSLEPEQRLALVAAIARNVVALERKQSGLELDGRPIEGESWES